MAKFKARLYPCFHFRMGMTKQGKAQGVKQGIKQGKAHEGESKSLMAHLQAYSY